MDAGKLLGLARAGDVSAFRELLGPHQDTALRTAQLITRDDGEAEDAVQDAFVKAYYRLGELRSDEAFRGWLLRIVANQALNRRRSAGRRQAAVERSRHEQPRHAPSAEEAALQSEDQRLLLSALNRLSEDDRLILGCRYFLELSQDETAQVAGIPSGTVKSRQSRALARLRTALTEFETDPLEANNV